ncbi:DUF721 domain-containing protein [Gluconobacter wancherniae]|uniref:DUF721 domain-containing protein n=1 Tax=Gluconobacter wancherniae NBRC 103581 TaxID=656744 RepID=A0A511B1X6_9PROT|nr:DciA family protein [Gluconobacter wancherniae]MBF0854583.1 DUF721 domain-containing protein [Gluconobacter wancherniae]MBS1063966.1 DUF721 domain-containing protein [Gluconobacter wancherniae]GBD57691.1 hypothetical protein NBRC103581_02283 [Gluconobacter wancherniae NBRC 103581]GBR62327.1 hypothetical protein AA103581_0253 [Gluconobacter wancherniae NBRC 103581]GEK94450.1 hypothetical protein GWA01_22200 [Gluconobacter wancherniae NBRC 103581]
MTKDRISNKHPTASSTQGNAQDGGWQPRKWGERQIGTFIPGLTKLAFKKKSPLLVRLMMDWEDFVGPRLGRETEPRRMSAGTLTLACSGPVAMELQHFAPQILERINTACGLRGEHTLKRLKVVQDMTAFETPRPVRPKPLQVNVADIDDEDLRQALERLGGHVSARRRRR